MKNILRSYMHEIQSNLQVFVRGTSNELILFINDDTFWWDGKQVQLASKCLTSVGQMFSPKHFWNLANSY